MADCHLGEDGTADFKVVVIHSYKMKPYLCFERNRQNILSFIVAIGGLGAAGYHIPMHRSGKSKVCDNRFPTGSWPACLSCAYC